MKKAILLTFLFTCLLGVNAQSFVAMTNGKRLCFNVLSKDDKTVEVSFRKNVKYTDTHYVIPSTIEYGGETYTVVAIGEKAFSDNKKIEVIELPNTIRTIGERAFDECKNLTKIVFSEGLVIIKERAFEQCTHLEELALPSGLVEIGEKAFFYNKRLKKVVLPNTLKVIDKWAFAFCIELNESDLNTGLERIDDFAFFATKFERIDIPNTVTFIGVKAFLSATKNIAQESIIKWLSIPESVMEIGKDAFCKFQGGFGNTLPTKCHIELLPSWVDEEEAKRIGIKSESFEEYLKDKK